MAPGHPSVGTAYLLPLDGVLPDLWEVERVCRVSDPEESVLDGTYFDTQDRKLAGHQITLCRETGAFDRSWYLKAPGLPAGARTTRRAASGAGDNVPSELVRAVSAYVRGDALVPVATVRTKRTQRCLFDTDGALAIVADDVVRAERPDADGNQAEHWREVDVEPLNGSGHIVHDCDAVFLTAGLVPFSFPTTLHHTLGARPEPVSATPVRGSAGEVVACHMDELVRELLRRDGDARENEQDGVRKMRVATRRLRTALATYRTLLVTERTEPLREELKWLGAALGVPRDAEVLRDQLSTAVRSLPRALRIGNLVRLLEVELQARHHDAHADLVEVLETPRYFELLDGLEALLDDPPLNDSAARPAAAVVDRLVRRAVRRVRKVADRADATEEDFERDLALHEVRKAAKRARYAAEAAAPALGKRSTKVARRMKRLQDLLGEVQDSVGIRRLLREMGEVAYFAPDDAFTFGLLYGRAEACAEIAMARYDDALRDALRPG